MDGICLGSSFPPKTLLFASANGDTCATRSPAHADCCSADPLSYYFFSQVKLPELIHGTWTCFVIF